MTTASSISSVQLQGITSKYELAQRMAGHSKAPTQALESIFKGAMSQFEKFAKVKFDPSLNTRVWDKVSKEHIEALNEFFLLQFCDLILGSFTARESDQLLAQHKKTKSISGMASGGFQLVYQLEYSEIIDSIGKKANSMTSELIPKIAKALSEEGVQLPQPKMSKSKEEGKKNPS